VFRPTRQKADNSDPDIVRYNRYERLFHLMATVSFLCLAVTGIAFLLKIDSPLGPMRTTHGYTGPIFTFSVVAILIVWFRDALFVRCDREWARRLGGYLWIKGKCPSEKFNAGQKAFFWFVVIGLGSVQSLTGALLIAGRGTADSWVYTLHDFTAVILICALTCHIYLALFANPGSLRGIITGRVKQRWAQRHHPNWLINREHTKCSHASKKNDQL
jgi:formate dehydrogenase subunit gamma